MRWLFLIVLSLNLAYLAWQISVPASDAYVNVQPLKNVPAIVLLSEMRNNAQPDIEQASLADKVTAPAQQEAIDSMASDEQPMADQVSDETVVVVEATSEELSEEVLAAASENVLVEEAPVTVAAEIMPEPSSQGESCYTLGPFRDLDKLRSLIREIKSYVVAADFRGQEEKERPLYWVYIKPEINLSKALETGERLKANKIKDFYIIREGEKINGISLGYFRSKGGAFRLAKKVTKQGFDVLTEPVFKTYTVYWLDYQLADGVSIPDVILDKYMRSTKTNKISRLSRDCDA